MVDTLIQQSKNSNSGFYLNDISSLIEKLEYLEKAKQKTILLGVSYALLDLIETKSISIKKYHYHGNWRHERSTERNGERRATSIIKKGIWSCFYL